MDVVLGESGLQYIGTDWTCQSGGGYMGGFQTYDEFLEKGPIQKMPKEIEAEIREYIEAYRIEGGATLTFTYINEVEGFALTDIFVHLDDNPIHIKRVHRTERLTIFKGSIKPGDHVFSFVLILRSNGDMKKIQGEIAIRVEHGTNEASLKTAYDASGKIVTGIVKA